MARMMFNVMHYSYKSLSFNMLVYRVWLKVCECASGSAQADRRKCFA